MNRISSRTTFFNKQIFPIVGLGLVGALTVSIVVSGQVMHSPAVLLMPLSMFVAVISTMKHFVRDLVDQVIDRGDSLIVKNGADEEVILLENIMNVSSSPYSRPPRITLRLINPCRLGREVSFIPAGALNPARTSKIAEDLIVRVHLAKFPPPE